MYKQCLMILWVGNTITFIGLLSVQPTVLLSDLVLILYMAAESDPTVLIK